jgi:two-component system, OmpR family, phosphate regulon sensor histidine kinase PhoR
MNYSIKKIGIILLLLALLPALIFTAYEVINMDENEKVVEEIYNNQLDAILFSVNQYSEDILSGWRSRLNLLLLENNFRNEGKQLEDFLKEADPLRFIYLKKITGNDGILIKGDSDLVSTIDTLLINREEEIKRLLTYQRGGYNKIEPLNTVVRDLNILLTLIQGHDGNYISVLGVEPSLFIQKYLGARLQETAREGFIITVINQINGSTVFSTERDAAAGAEQLKPLWMFPRYNIGIRMRSGDLNEAISSRMNNMLLLIGFLMLVLLAGVWFIFRTIKREVELAQIKSDFVSNVSHELRTPLALISMYAETLEMGRVKTEEKKREYYSIISHETNRLGRIVNQILSFSKMEAGKREFHFDRIEISEIAANVYENYKFHLEQKGFEFKLEANQKELFIMGDKEAIAEAIINLVDNGAKYSKDRLFVSLRTGSEKGKVYIEVEDKGIGISSDDQKKVFDKFYRVSTGLVHNTKGTGLGLSLVKQITDAHGGEVEVESSPGKGSRFKILFPEIK